MEPRQFSDSPPLLARPIRTASTSTVGVAPGCAPVEAVVVCPATPAGVPTGGVWALPPKILPMIEPKTLIGLLHCYRTLWKHCPQSRIGKGRTHTKYGLARRRALLDLATRVICGACTRKDAPNAEMVHRHGLHGWHA